MHIKLKAPAREGNSYNTVSKHDSLLPSLSSEYKHFFYLTLVLPWLIHRVSVPLRHWTSCLSFSIFNYVLDDSYILNISLSAFLILLFLDY